MEIAVMLVAMSPFLMVVAIVWIAFNANTQRRKATLSTIEEAIRGGQQMTPETIKALGMPAKSNANGDLKSGMILMAVAAAILFLGWATESFWGDGFLAIMTAVASFPGFIGLVLIGFGLMGRKKEQENAA
ncbi:MAG: hypothetical protein JJ884_10320 [Maricaulis sp.]|uniref:DUF6249 domain-containing protein n=1 Tax=Maricaulis sp. TaxID=1486257 RepID=UPI001AFE41F8|nr:DUF6249 domain-containing protein [Maricaulis sp.]MBO6728280.1 hypothetical protein [Maricaulis sp.]MBO6847901.1 hypothetical protein [Maricaulis sp.]MBO6877524.1 hypothetical protein [Maricaulis sp.]